MKSKRTRWGSKERQDLVDRSPRSNWMGELQSGFIRRALYPTMQRRWHPRASRYLEELRRFEFASPETIERVQWTRLQALLEHAAKHVPYYRDLFRERGIQLSHLTSPQDFARMPVLNKSILQAKPERLLAEDRAKGAGVPNASGGSTGKPAQFFQDAEYWDRACASQWFVEQWWGIRPGDRTASLWGADRDIPEQTWKERFWSAIAQTRVCNAFALTVPQMERFLKMLVSWQPRYVIGYASALEVFSRFLLERPAFRVRPHAVKTTAEALTEEQREIIEKAFACPVYNFYGSREINNLAAECPAHQGMHVNALGRYVEIVDDAGHALPPGVPGRILVTDLTNYFMPFLRYEIEDIGSWTGKPCDCGRPFPQLERVWGRMSDFIVTPEGKLIHGEFFTHLFYDLSEVALFQLEQKSLVEIHVKVALRPGISNNPVERLRTRLENALGPKIHLAVETVESITRPPSGKHRFTVSSVRPSWGKNAHGLSESSGVAVR